MALRNGLSEELNRQGNEHFARGHYTDAYACYAKALECDRLTGDHRALSATLGNLGNICAVSGRRESAQSYYQEVLELQKVLGDEKGIGTTLANLGNLRADAGEWDRARAYYLEALDIMTRVHDELGKAVLFSDLGLVARETGQFEEALRYYEQSLVLMRRLNNQGGVADAWRMMGRTFAIQKRYDDAIACCHTSQSIAERSRDELRTGGARYVLAQCYEDLGQLQMAVQLLEQVVRMDRKYDLPKLAENVTRLERLRARLGAEDPTPPASGVTRMNAVALPSWEQARARLVSTVPQFYELEPGGALALDLGDDGWLLEVRSDGQLLCQHGIAMDDVKSLMCDGTTEDLGTDEVAKQAKYFLGPAVSKKRPALLKAGFAEQTDMNDEYVAITFHKTVDFQRFDEVLAAVRWCQNLFKIEP